MKYLHILAGIVVVAMVAAILLMGLEIQNIDYQIKDLKSDVLITNKLDSSTQTEVKNVQGDVLNIPDSTQSVTQPSWPSYECAENGSLEEILSMTCTPEAQ